MKKNLPRNQGKGQTGEIIGIRIDFSVNKLLWRHL